MSHADSTTVLDTQAAFWQQQLKPLYFQDRDIDIATPLVQLSVPDRAEDSAYVPIKITSTIPQTPEHYLKTLYLLIDHNPSPLAGKFTFTPESGKADLSLFIRVNAYSPVRVIAETNDGQLSMVSHFVKASGGCSAPPPTNLSAVQQRLGEMRFQLASVEQSLAAPIPTRLAIRHPNITGLQRDQLTTLLIPPHYVKAIKVSFNDTLIFAAATDISLSENPDIQFYFKPTGAGILKAEMTDTKGQVFTHTEHVTTPES